MSYITRKNIMRSNQYIYKIGIVLCDCYAEMMTMQIGAVCSDRCGFANISFKFASA